MGRVVTDGKSRKTVGYARVASGVMTDALAEQVERLKQSAYDLDECVTEVGSIFDGSRPVLLGLLADPDIETIVVDYEDRLAHFGFEYIQAAMEGRGARVIALEKGHAPRERIPLTADLPTRGVLDQGNAGQPWTIEDYQVMVAGIRAGEDATEISASLYRRPGGIASRLKWLMPVEQSEGMRPTEVLEQLRTFLEDPNYDWQSMVLENHAERSKNVPAPVFDEEGKE